MKGSLLFLWPSDSQCNSGRNGHSGDAVVRWSLTTCAASPRWPRSGSSAVVLRRSRVDMASAARLRFYTDVMDCPDGNAFHRKAVNRRGRPIGGLCQGLVRFLGGDRVSKSCCRTTWR